MTSTIVLTIPVGRERCSEWIALQPPPIVADVLDVSEAAFNALQRELSSGEAARRAEELDAAKAEVEAAIERGRRERGLLAKAHGEALDEARAQLTASEEQRACERRQQALRADAASREASKLH